jgi:hypothetical protein
MGPRNFAGPYVTSVGGTTGLASDSEVASDFSGGGFSKLYPTPQYQRSAVRAFLGREGPQMDYARGRPLQVRSRSCGLTQPILTM